jgi:phage gp29-like protein
MWIFHTEGLLSIVEDRNDKKLLMVRARRREHITKVFPHATPIHTPNADYHWRISVTRGQVQAVMIQMLDNLDYDNFKDAANPMLKTVYSNIWADGLALEKLNERVNVLGPDEDKSSWPRYPY